jgi:DNA mismatch repair protein MutH
MLEKGLVHKQEALHFLRRTLLNKNMKELANSYSVPIFFGQKINKGWIGQTIERHLGLQNNTLNEPDGFDYELKTTEVFLKNNTWGAKETLKITQMNPSSILQEEFETSVFWKKLKALILVTYEKKEDYFICRSVLDIHLSDKSFVGEIKQFWEDVRNAVCSGEIRDFINLGSSDSLIQLRPQGDGKQKSVCPISGENFPSRSFYATKKLVNQLISQK